MEMLYWRIECDYSRRTVHMDHLSRTDTQPPFGERTKHLCGESLIHLLLQKETATRRRAQHFLKSIPQIDTNRMNTRTRMIMKIMQFSFMFFIHMARRKLPLCFLNLKAC